MIENDEPSLQQQFVYCENIVEDLLHDRLGDSKSQQRNVRFSFLGKHLTNFHSRINSKIVLNDYN